MNRQRRFFLPLAVLALLLVPFLWKSALASSFYDVQDDQLYSPYIQKLYDAHLITGDTDNGKETFRYRPKDSLTRAEFTKVAVGVKLAEKYGVTEDWQSKSTYEITETVLKDKLLYFHGCDNSDLSNCATLCSADICGVCNVCTVIGDKPFTDVAEKERNCEEQKMCSPWYSEYIYYAQRKGMVWGYHKGSSYAFHPDDPILRIHALKLVMANDGAVDPEADERYRRLSQTAKSRGSYYPKCLSGAEDFILTQNGGGADAEKLLKYALLADKLDFFGNTCQVFNEKGARTPEAKATFLHSPITRQEVARYFVLSTSYSPLQYSAANDPTVEEMVSEITDEEAPEADDDTRPTTPIYQLTKEAIGEIGSEPVILDPTKVEMSIRALTALSKQGRCCSVKSLKDCSTKKFSALTISEEPDEYLNSQVWYKATQPNGSTCWVPFGDIFSGYSDVESVIYLPASLSNSEFRTAGFSIEDAQLQIYNFAAKTVRYQEIIKNLDAYYADGHSAEETRKWALRGKTPGTDDYNYVELWYQERKKVEENFKKLGLFVDQMGEKIETEVQKTLTGWERRAQIYNRLDQYYAQNNDLEAAKRWGLTGKEPDQEDFAYVMQWYEGKIEAQRIQAEKDADYFGKALVDGFNSFGAGVAGTTIYVIEVVDNGVIKPVGVMIEDGVNNPEKCFAQGGEQIVYGEFTDKVNICGTAGQLGLSFTGLDLPADVRDVIASLEKGDGGGVLMNGIGLIPVIGMVKNTDELATVYKAASKLSVVRRGTEAISSLTKKLSGAVPKQVITQWDELYYYAKIKKPQFDKKLSVVATEVGAKAEFADLKTMVRADQKVDDVLENASGIKDMVRGTLTFDDTDALKAAFPNIQKNYDIVEIKDRITTPLKNGYQDINMVVKDKDGFLMEVRLSTKKMYAAAKKEHPIYEISRQLDIKDVSKRSLDDINKAVAELKIESPDIYERIKKNIDDIINHVDKRLEGEPPDARKELFKESKAIFDGAK